jgi:hypothetical protein
VRGGEAAGGPPVPVVCVTSVTVWVVESSPSSGVQTTLRITWAQPASITVGTPLSATRLNATANVPDALSYNPLLGTKLAVGAATLTVTFTPKDSANYQTGQARMQIAVRAADFRSVRNPASTAKKLAG